MDECKPLPGSRGPGGRGRACRPASGGIASSSNPGGLVPGRPGPGGCGRAVPAPGEVEESERRQIAAADEANAAQQGLARVTVVA